jgi:serine/threonine-protein kinase
MLVSDNEPTHGSLRERLQACRQQGLPGIPEEELLGYMHAVAQRLDDLHSHNALHRDVRPANMLLRNGCVQLAQGHAPKTPGSISSAAIAYCCAPELIEPANPSSKTDQYALAISYCELRTGALPFPHKSLYEMTFAHLQGRLDLSRLIGSEQAVLSKALANDPGQRYSSCLTFVQALEQAASERESG